MDVDIYVWQKRTTLKKMSEKIGVSMTCMSGLKRKVTSPHLLVAIKLIKESEGEISMEELLTDADKKKLKLWELKREKRMENEKNR